MRMELTIKFADSTSQKVTARFPDFAAWERYSGKTVSSLAASPGINDLASLCWIVSKRELGEQRKYELWLESVEEIEAAEYEDPKATSAEV